MVPGDEILVEELDRFGRNKAEIKAELEWFKEHGIIVRVFDVPTTLMDFHGQDWIGEMVNNILMNNYVRKRQITNEYTLHKGKNGVPKKLVINKKLRKADKKWIKKFAKKWHVKVVEK